MNKVKVVGIAVPAPMDMFVAGKVALARERVGYAVADMPMGARHSPVEISVENKVGAVVPAAPVERGQRARELLCPSRNLTSAYRIPYNNYRSQRGGTYTWGRS